MEMEKRKDKIKEAKAQEVHSEDSSGKPRTFCMARIRESPPMDQLYVPESKEERQNPNFLDLEVTSGEEDVDVEVIK